MKRDKHNRPTPGQPAPKRGGLLKLDRTTLKRLETTELENVVGASACTGCSIVEL